MRTYLTNLLNLTVTPQVSKLAIVTHPKATAMPKNDVHV